MKKSITFTYAFGPYKHNKSHKMRPFFSNVSFLQCTFLFAVDSWQKEKLVVVGADIQFAEKRRSCSDETTKKGLQESSTRKEDFSKRRSCVVSVSRRFEENPFSRRFFFIDDESFRLSFSASRG